MTSERPLGAWMKLYADVVHRKAHYTDAQFRALIEVYAQSVQLHGLLPTRRALDARHDKANIDFLFIEGDLNEGVDGNVAVHRWSDYQSDVRVDPTGAERQRRLRESRKTLLSRDDDAMSSSSSSSSSSNTPRTENDAREEVLEADPLDVVWQLTGRYPSGKVRVWVDSLTETYGDKRVVKALAEAHTTQPDKFIGLAEDLLKRDSVKAEKAERDRAARDRTEAMSRPASTPEPIGGWDVDGSEYAALQADLQAKREA